MYHRSAGEKSIILNISGNPRAETDMFSFFSAEGLPGLKRRRKSLPGGTVFYTMWF
jgi:hypothetical protein